MKSLLDALQEGRLVELSETDKDKALEYLALLVEAIPDIGTQMDIVKEVKDREAQSPTGIG
jgi:predicted house-cleaning noncanonical NTP pyrophosphatase (MazG superfamily)